jgi:hypothetical protein
MKDVLDDIDYLPLNHYVNHHLRSHGYNYTDWADFLFKIYGIDRQIGYTKSSLFDTWCNLVGGRDKLNVYLFNTVLSTRFEAFDKDGLLHEFTSEGEIVAISLIEKVSRLIASLPSDSKSGRQHLSEIALLGLAFPKATASLLPWFGEGEHDVIAAAQALYNGIAPELLQGVLANDIDLSLAQSLSHL